MNYAFLRNVTIVNSNFSDVFVFDSGIIDVIQGANATLQFHGCNFEFIASNSFASVLTLNYDLQGSSNNNNPDNSLLEIDLNQVDFSYL